jgi:hypothetical protein
MSDATYEPSAASAGPESTEAERRARQLAQFVETERRRRRATLRFYLALLLIPVALAAAGLLLAREAAPVSDEALRQQVTPLVEHKVEEQMRPVVEEKLGGQIDTVIEQRVGDKIQGASPERVRELGENVEQVRRDISEVRAGVQQVQEVGAALPKIRQQLDEQGSNMRRIQERMTGLPNGGGDEALVAEFRRLQGRLGSLEQKLENSVETLMKRMDDNSRQIRDLSGRLPASDKDEQPRTRRTPERQKQR